MPAKPSGLIKTSVIKKTQKNGDIYIIERQIKYDPEAQYNKVIASKLISKIPKGSETPVPTRPKRKKSTSSEEKSVIIEASRQRTGMMDIISHIGEVSGIDDAIYAATDRGSAQKIISLARYLLATNGQSLPGIQTWQYNHPLPYEDGITEEIYHNLVCSVDKNAPESIHLCDFPVVDEKMVDKKLEAAMDEVLKIVVMGRACRNTSNIKNRQPIGKMYVKAPEKLDKFYVDIIADELNVKEVEFTDDVSSYTTYQFKPQLRTVGPKYGKYLKQIQAALAELDGNKAYAQLKETGELKLDSISTEVVLLEEDLLVTMTQMEGYVTESDNSVTVVLDTNLTPELIEEGFVRELISKIQTMRKEAGFEVMDHIAITFKADEKVTAIFEKYGDAIKSEVLAESIAAGALAGYEKDWNINGEKVQLAVEKNN